MAPDLAPPSVTALQYRGFSGDQHIRVYFQRDDGFIYQSIWNERGGWEPTVQKLYEAKLGTSITANYLGLADGIIRIFFSSPNDDISLASYLLPKDKWTDPSTILSASVGKILSITSLAATGWFVEGRGTFRLFYQRQDFTIQELVQATGDDPWVLGTRFKVPAYPGSSITASSVASLSNSDGSHRVYYQATDTSIYELAWGTDGVIWTEVHHNVTIPPRSGLGSTIWRSADNIHAKLYFLNNSGVIQEWQFDGGWNLPTIPVSDAITGYSFPLVATRDDFGSHHPSIRVYFQLAIQAGLTELLWTSDAGWKMETFPF